MIAAGIFDTVEFYVIAATVAAAVVAASAVPSRRGAARTFLIGGTLDCGSGADAPTEGAIEAEVLADGRLRLRRTGLTGIKADGAYSLAVEIIGLDVTIKERLTPTRRPMAGNTGAEIDCEATSAEAVLDCLGRERYHILYLSEATARSAAFSLNISPGNRISRPLSL